MSRRLIIGPKAALEALYAKVDALLVASLGPPINIGGGVHIQVPPPTTAYHLIESDRTGAIWGYPVDDYSRDIVLGAIADAKAPVDPPKPDGEPDGEPKAEPPKLEADLPQDVEQPADWKYDPNVPHERAP